MEDSIAPSRRSLCLAAVLSLAATSAFAQAIENRLVIVTSFSKDVTEPFAQAFQKKYPVTRVEVWDTAGGVVKTIADTPLQEEVPTAFDAAPLGPREIGGLFDGILGAFSSWRELELESVEFERRFSLWVADRSDDLAVRRFFTPAVIVRCLDQPPAGRLEIGAGVLCLSVQRHLVEPDDLDGVAAELTRWATMLRQGAAHVVGRAPVDVDGTPA